MSLITGFGDDVAKILEMFLIASEVLLYAKLEEGMFSIQRMLDSTGLPIFQCICCELLCSLRFEEHVCSFVEI